MLYQVEPLPDLMVRPIGVEPITFWSVVKRSIQLSYERTCLLRIRLLAHKIIFSRWWLQLESNQRHQDFQSCALPTELWSHLAVPTGLEPAIPRVTGECDNHYTTGPHWLRRLDLNQRPLGYEPNELPGCSIPRFEIIIYSYGGGKGIRTPAPMSWPPGFQDRSLQPDLGISP